MIFNVRVNPRSGSNRVERSGNALKVCLTRPAVDGEANSQLVGVLSTYFKVRKYQVRIKNGEKSRNKLVEIDADI